jgi:sulfoxide reductase catalytic subunit YedY
LPSSEITPESVYVNRRTFMRAAIAAGAGAALTAPGTALVGDASAQAGNVWPIANATKSPLSTNEKVNAFEDITGYNNFYEFGTDKSDPARYAGKLTVRPWTTKIDGHVAKPGAVPDRGPAQVPARGARLSPPLRRGLVDGDPVDRLSPGRPAEEGRADVEGQVRRLRDAARPGEMPGQRQAALEWPYVEGLRLDEAMHPLTILAVGLYGKTLLTQNGAPLRLVVPWKYGFKSIKSIVGSRSWRKQPSTSWNIANSSEYGFYSNVNPTVDHPRWTQSRERRIGEFARRPTLMFNGYADQVASM